MKKIIALVLMLAVVASLGAVFAACGPKVLPDFVIPEGGYDGSKVTIAFYSSMGQYYESILNDALADFNKLYPNINIDHTRVGDYPDVRDRVSKDIEAGSAPNVAFCYSDHVALYNKSKSVVALDDLIASEIDTKRGDNTTEPLGLTAEQKADFIQTYYNEGKAFGDGKMYMLPFAKSTELMYFNKTVFDSLELKTPDHWFATDGKIGTESADDTSMEYVLYALKEYNKESFPLGYDSGANWLITLFEQYGYGYTSATGEHYRFDNENNYKLLEVLNRWYQDGLFTTKKLAQGTYTSEYFKAQKSYISIGSSAGAAKQVPEGSDAFTVDVAMVPQKDPGMTSDPSKCKVISQGPSICLFKSKNPQEVVASWLLVKFLVTNKVFEARYGMSAGYLPVINSVKDLDIYRETLENADTGENMSGMAAKMCTQFQEALFTSPAFYGSSEARDQMENLLGWCAVIERSDSHNNPIPTATIMNQIKQQFKKALANCEN